MLGRHSATMLPPLGSAPGAAPEQLPDPPEAICRTGNPQTIMGSDDRQLKYDLFVVGCPGAPRRSYETVSGVLSAWPGEDLISSGCRHVVLPWFSDPRYIVGTPADQMAAPPGMNAVSLGGRTLSRLVLPSLGGGPVFASQVGGN